MPTTTTTAIPRTALYARVSTTGHGQDVGLQLDELRAVARQRGWNVVAEHVDDGVSGAATSRPALDRLMDAARRGHLDLVVVWKLDRLGRSLQHLLAVLDELQHVGVGFVSIRDAGIDTTSASGRLLLHLLGAFACDERELTKERVLAGVRRAQSRGTHCGGPRVTLDVRPALALARIKCQAPRPCHRLPGRCRTFAPVDRRSRVVDERLRGVAGRSRVVAGRSRVVTNVAEAVRGAGAGVGPLDRRADLA